MSWAVARAAVGNRGRIGSCCVLQTKVKIVFHCKHIGKRYKQGYNIIIRFGFKHDHSRLCVKQLLGDNKSITRETGYETIVTTVKILASIR